MSKAPPLHKVREDVMNGQEFLKELLLGLVAQGTVSHWESIEDGLLVTMMDRSMWRLDARRVRDSG